MDVLLFCWNILMKEIYVDVWSETSIVAGIYHFLTLHVATFNCDLLCLWKTCMEILSIEDSRICKRRENACMEILTVGDSIYERRERRHMVKDDCWWWACKPITVMLLEFSKKNIATPCAKSTFRRITHAHTPIQQKVWKSYIKVITNEIFRVSNKLRSTTLTDCDELTSNTKLETYNYFNNKVVYSYILFNDNLMFMLPEDEF